MKKKSNPTRAKRKLRSEADKLWFQICIKREPNCVICSKPAIQVHHFYSKNQYGYLRYDLDNGVSLCLGHHFHLHHQSDPNHILILDIVEKRGQKWADDLQAKSKELHPSLTTIGYYNSNIERLTEYLNEN